MTPKCSKNKLKWLRSRLLQAFSLFFPCSHSFAPPIQCYQLKQAQFGHFLCRSRRIYSRLYCLVVIRQWFKDPDDPLWMGQLVFNSRDFAFRSLLLPFRSVRDINGPITINNLRFKRVKDAQTNNYDLRFLSCLLSLTAVGEVFHSLAKCRNASPKWRQGMRGGCICSWGSIHYFTYVFVRL